jgi:hypothetical protein
MTGGFRAGDHYPLTAIRLQLFALPRLRMPSRAVIIPYLCHDEFNNLPPMILLEDFDQDQDTSLANMVHCQQFRRSKQNRTTG